MIRRHKQIKEMQWAELTDRMFHMRLQNTLGIAGILSSKVKKKLAESLWEPLAAVLLRELEDNIKGEEST